MDAAMGAALSGTIPHAPLPHAPTLVGWLIQEGDRPRARGGGREGGGREAVVVALPVRAGGERGAD